MRFYRHPKTFCERRNGVGTLADVRAEAGEWGCVPVLPLRLSRRVGRDGYGLPMDWDDLVPSRYGMKSWKDTHRSRNWTRYRPVSM